MTDQLTLTPEDTGEIPRPDLDEPTRPLTDYIATGPFPTVIRKPVDDADATELPARTGIVLDDLMPPQPGEPPKPRPRPTPPPAPGPHYDVSNEVRRRHVGRHRRPSLLRRMFGGPR